MTAGFSRKEVLSGVKRIVLKLGSSVVTTEKGLDHPTIRGLVNDVCRYIAQGKEFIIVSSGAVAAGARRMRLTEPPRTIPQKQAAASVGQTRLMVAYEAAFGTHGIRVGQVLLTRDDISHRHRYLNARNTLMTLLAWGAVPVINENDTVMVEEIKLGDNDNLSALVAALCDADLLTTLTDTEGLMDCDPTQNPDACLIPLVEEIKPELKKLASGPSSGVGRGGMASKIAAAEKTTVFGIPMIIAPGKTPSIIPRIMKGEICGTLILAAKERMSARKHWIRYNLEPEGTLAVDEGAATALTRNKKSLLPVGLIHVDGRFEPGAAVKIRDRDGVILAVGLSNYSSEELEKVRGRQTAEIDWVLGYRRNEEVVHVDNMVILADEEA
ncbi:MAG: glutamate 5-kinase [Pseudomonadota bacterium]